MSSRTPSPPCDDANVYNGGGAASTDRRPFQQPNFLRTSRPETSQSNASPSINTLEPDQSLHPQDGTNSFNGWREWMPLSSVNSAHPPLPLRAPSQSTRIVHTPDPTVPAENMCYSSPFSDPSGSNGAGPSVHEDDGYGSNIFPPLSRSAYPPGRVVDHLVDYPSRKKLVPSKKPHFICLLSVTKISKS